MNALSWNVKGLGARPKRSSLRKLIRTNYAQIVFVQETKCEEINPKLIKTIWNNPDVEWRCQPSTGNPGGILSMWNSKFFIMDSCRIERNWLAITGRMGNFVFNCSLINIYNLCNLEERIQVWNAIYLFGQELGLPCLILGDFNETMQKSERGSQLLSTTGEKNSGSLSKRRN